ncbi:MAG: Maf family protein, partial [Gammaproteobacteria bacterium]|nr:Maf family protein [Gammaproteobacteria bacterium]
MTSSIQTSQQPRLILASSSPYRKALLSQLMLPFEVITPGIDEQAKPGESAPELVKRLSIEKARSVAVNQSNALVIGSDQVAVH